MYPMNPSMSSIAVSRHDDYLAEANRDHMARIARQGKPRTTVLADVRRNVGGVVIAIGERVAGRPVATGPAMPGISSLR